MCHLLIFACNPQEQSQTFTLKQTYCLFAKALSLECIPFRIIILLDLECNPL